MTRRFSALLFLALFLSSCTKSDAPSDGKIHIKLVHFFVDQKEIWKRNVVEAFEKANPNVVVDVEAIPFGLYTTKIQSTAAAGSMLGDVVLIDDWFGQELFNRNYTLALDSLFDRDFKRDDFFYQFFRVWRKGNSEQGALMAMPACGGVTALFYNKDLFDKAGVAYPDSTWTYERFLEAAKKLTNPVAKTWGFVMDDGGSTGIDTYLYSNGGKILTDDYAHSAIATRESQAAVQSYVDLVRKHKVAPEHDPSQGMGQKFLQGRYAMMLNFDAAKQELAKAPFKWDLTVPPHGAGGMMSRQNGQAFAIARQSTHPAEAWSLIKYIVTLPEKKGINELFNTSMPLYKPLAESAEYLNGEPKCDRRALLAINNGKVFTLITPGWQEWRDHGFVPNMQDMLAGRKTVAEGTKAIAEKIDQVLGKK